MTTPQPDLFSPPACPVYTDGVHLSLDYNDWITPASEDRKASAAWDRFEAVHALARRIGLKPSWFQNKRGSYPHYDLTTPEAARRAVEAGALLLMEWKDYARIAAQPGSRFRSLEWRPSAYPLENALSMVEARNLRLMAIFAPGRRIGHRGKARLR